MLAVLSATSECSCYEELRTRECFLRNARRNLPQACIAPEIAAQISEELTKIRPQVLSGAYSEPTRQDSPSFSRVLALSVGVSWQDSDRSPNFSHAFPQRRPD